MMQGFNWMFHSYGQFEFDMNEYPLAKFAINLCNQRVLNPEQILSQNLQNNIKVEYPEKKPVKGQENQVSDLNNDMTMQNSIKLELKVRTDLQIEKIKNFDYKYFDPHQAPSLTFGIDDILVIPKRNLLNRQQHNKNCRHKNTFQQAQQIVPEYGHDYSRQIQFRVKQPDPRFTPFLIVKKKPIIKKKVLSQEEFQKRAHMIEVKRVKNIQKMQIEERIGKKLPVKNKKWKRKKPSLVFNSYQYKKRLITSKKYKESRQNYDKLLFSSV